MNENSELRIRGETQQLEFAQEKKLLEDTIADLGSVDERTLTTQKTLQEDLARQMRLAQVCRITARKYTKLADLIYVLS